MIFADKHQFRVNLLCLFAHLAQCPSQGMIETSLTALLHTCRLFWFWLTANSESCRGHCSRWVMCLVIPWTWQITCIWTAVRSQSSFVFVGKRKLVFSGRRSKYLIEKQQFCFHGVCYQVDGGHVWLSIVKEITGPLYFKQPRVYKA